MFLTGSNDCENNIISVDVIDNSANIWLYTINDAITLEYDDAVLLRFRANNRGSVLLRLLSTLYMQGVLLGTLLL